MSRGLLCFLVLFSVNVYGRGPVGFSMYSRADQIGWTANHAGTCQNLLTEGKGLFESVTFVLDFLSWHQGDPKHPPSQPYNGTPQEGYIYVSPSNAAAAADIVSCASEALKMGYSPVVMKFKIMDYVGPDLWGNPQNYWRANADFDPTVGNYESDPYGPVALATSSAISICSVVGELCSRLIISVNDEYTASLRIRSDSWIEVFRNMRKTLSDAGAPVRIAADVDWTLAYFPNIHNGDAGRALAELDMVGWSLYRPFIGVTQGFVKWEQKEHVKDLRRWMDGHSLKGKPLAIFEFGVTQRLLPSDWNKNHFSKADQRNAYLSWIDLLQTPGGSDVVGPFTFWFGMDDPRTSLSNDEISRGYAEPN